MGKTNMAAILISANSKFLYGYRTPNGAAEQARLGFELIEAATPSKDVAFSPKNKSPFSAYKPGIVSKGGLAAFAKIAELQNTGFVLSRKIRALPKAGPKSVIVGVRLTPDLVFTWRYPKTKWDVLPQAVRDMAGIQLASSYPVLEQAYHADGFMFKVANADLDVPAATYIGVKSLKRTFSDPATGKNYSLYSGKPIEAPAPNP
jgi:hypothetical protein